MKYFLIIGIFLLILSFSYAGTVTLTGVCSKSLNGNVITFNLSNSGNQAAYAINIIPKITNVTLNSTRYFTNMLNPQSSYNVQLLLKNITGNGTYVDYFKVSYQQSNTTFDALFPCVSSFYIGTNSNIVLNKTIIEKNNTYYINTTLFNNGNTQKVVNVSINLPNNFEYVSKNYNVLLINGKQSKTVNFVVKAQSSNGSYSGDINAAYVSNGLHYASYSPIVLLQNQKNFSLPNISISPIYILIAGILLILFLLIIRAFLKSRKIKS